MKTGRATPISAYVYCPYCGEGACSPQDGSYQWVLQKVQKHWHKCGECGERFKLPVWMIRREAR